MNLASDKVIVYPSARRANQGIDEFRSARLVGEKSIVDIVKHVLDFDSFVLSKDFGYDSSFEFILAGYYFSIIISASNIPSPTPSDLYAYIDIDSTDTDFAEIEGIDEDDVYTGLTIVYEQPAEVSGRHFLHLLYWDSTLNEGQGGWAIPKESKYKFYFTNVFMNDYDVIDCGTVPAE